MAVKKEGKHRNNIFPIIFVMIIVVFSGYQIMKNKSHVEKTDDSLVKNAYFIESDSIDRGKMEEIERSGLKYDSIINTQGDLARLQEIEKDATLLDRQKKVIGHCSVYKLRDKYVLKLGGQYYGIK